MERNYNSEKTYLIDEESMKSWLETSKASSSSLSFSCSSMEFGKREHSWEIKRISFDYDLGWVNVV